MWIQPTRKKQKGQNSSSAQNQKSHFQVAHSWSVPTNIEINQSLSDRIERVSGNRLGTLTLSLKGARYHLLCMLTMWLGCCKLLAQIQRVAYAKTSFQRMRTAYLTSEQHHQLSLTVKVPRKAPAPSSALHIPMKSSLLYCLLCPTSRQMGVLAFG